MRFSPLHLDLITSDQLRAIVTVVGFYLFFVACLILYQLTFGPIRSFDELSHELGGFVSEYKETEWWWLTSLVVTGVSLVIGSDPGSVVDIIILGMLFLPALGFFRSKYPFSLKCDHRPAQPSLEGIEHPDSNGTYAIDLKLTTGSNIDDFEIELELPQGIEASNVQPSPNRDTRLSDDRKVIIGSASTGNDTFITNLVLRKTKQINPGGEWLIISDSNSGRKLTSIRLMP